MATAFVGLGSSLGDRRRALDAALARLGSALRVTVDAVSPVFETSPVGVGGGPFLNAVARLGTGLPPSDLLELLLATEAAQGRVRRGPPGPRAIDLDLLLYGGLRIRSGRLEVPHPALGRRRFVLEPLACLAPDLQVPGAGACVARLAAAAALAYPAQRVRRLPWVLDLSASRRKAQNLDRPKPPQL